MTAITVEIPGVPVAYARTGGKGTRRFTPTRQRNAMADIKVMAAEAMAGRKPLEGPLGANITFEWPIPASWSKRRRAAPEAVWRTSKPDADNLLKLVADSLNGIVWNDDALLARVCVSKRYGDRAQTTIRVYPLEGSA